MQTAVSAAAAQAEAKAGDLMSAFSAAAAKIINTAAAAAGVAPAGAAVDPVGTDLITVLDGLQELQQQGQDVTGTLAALGLDQPGFSYLLQLHQLAGAATGSDAAGFITDQEWADARDVVVAAYRRLKQPIWQQEEVTANCLLGPDAFQINGSGPDLGTYRAEPTARQDWQRVLAGRIAEDAALSAAADSLLAATESATLPVLRDALLDDITTAFRRRRPGVCRDAERELDLEHGGRKQRHPDRDDLPAQGVHGRGSVVRCRRRAACQRR